tara:strand:- start:1259 stop:1555 length:297 start_codon:yes stop_codon:yes gene_type:complete
MSTREDREWDEQQDRIADDQEARVNASLLHPELTRELHDTIWDAKKTDVDLAELDDQVQSAAEGFDTAHGFFPNLARVGYAQQAVIDTVLEQYGIDPE